MDNITIEETKAFRIGETAYLLREDAERCALTVLLRGGPNKDMADPALATDAANAILNCRDQVIAILTGTKPRKPRADRGKSHRKPQAPAEVKDSPEPGVLPGVKVEPSSKYRNK